MGWHLMLDPYDSHSIQAMSRSDNNNKTAPPPKTAKQRLLKRFAACRPALTSGRPSESANAGSTGRFFVSLQLDC